MRKVFPLLLAAGIILACSNPKPNAILAVAVPLSGPIGAEGGGIVRAVKLAASGFNDSDENSWNIVVRAYDDQGTPQGAVKAAGQITENPKVFAVIGDFTSDSCLAAAPVYAESLIPMITPSAANSVLTAQQKSPSWKWKKSIFRMPPTDLSQAKFAAHFAYSRLGIHSFFIVDDQSSYGMEFSEAFGSDFKKEGGKILGFVALPPNPPNLSGLISALEASKPQGLFFGGFYPEAANILKSLRDNRLGITFFSGGASKEDTLFKLAGPASNGAYFVISGVPVDFLPGADPFISQYRSLFKTTPRTYDIYAYEAAKISLAAFQKAGFDRKKMIATLRETEYDGIIGMTRFDDKGDNTNDLVSIVRANYEKRKFEPVY